MGLIADMAGKQGLHKGAKLPVPTTDGDDQVIAAKTGEYVLTPEMVEALGGVKKLDAMALALTGEQPGGKLAMLPGEHAPDGMMGYAAGGAVKDDLLRQPSRTIRELDAKLPGSAAGVPPSRGPSFAPSGGTAPASGINYELPPGQRVSVNSATMADFEAAQRAKAGASPQPTQTPATPKGGLISRLGAGARIAGGAAAAVPEAINVGRVALDPRSSGLDVATQTAEGAGKLASAALGAKAGAALGALTGPAAPVAVPALSLAGGLGGYFGGEKLIEKGRELLGVNPDSPAEQLAGGVVPQANAAAPQRPSFEQSLGKFIADERDTSKPLAGTSAPQDAQATYDGIRNDIGRGITAQAGSNPALQQAGDAGLRTLASNPGLVQRLNAQYQRDNIGVQANVDGNGRMAFSDAPMDPNRETVRRGITSGVDLKSANESMARANAIRAGNAELADGINFNNGGALSRQKTQDEIVRDMLTSKSRTDRQVAGSLIANLGANQLKRAELDADAQTRSLRNRGLAADATAKEGQQALLQQIQKTTDPTQRNSLVQQLNLMRGGEANPSAKDRYITLKGGQTVDPTTNMVRYSPDVLFDANTQRPVNLGPQAAEAPYQDGARLQGKDGKTYVVKNGRPVLEGA